MGNKYWLAACSATALLLGSGGMAMAATATDSAGATTTEAAAPTSTIGDVVITARKRQENLQRVPVAITAQTGAQLEQQRIVQPTDLGRIVPSMRTFFASSSDNSAQIALRGQVASDVLIGISQPVGLYEDTVNIPHPFGANNAFFDLSRVEVLHGPQGTLYGRNTTGGAINIITRDADFSGFHGFITGEVGNFQDYKWGGAFNIPLIADQLAVRIAYQRWDRNGFGHSLLNGQDLGDDHHDNLLRVSIKWNPRDNLHGNFKMEYGDAHHTGQFLANVSLCGAVNGPTNPPVCSFVPAAANFASLTAAQRRAAAVAIPNSAFIQNAVWSDPTNNVPLLLSAINGGNAAAFNQLGAIGQSVLANCFGFTHTNCLQTHEYDNLTTWHGVGDITWDITPDISLRSITGYHGFTDWKDGDLDATGAQILDIGIGTAASGGLPIAPELGPRPVPYDLKADQQSGQFTQEFDLTGKDLFGRVNWLVGAFMSVDRGHGTQTSAANEDIAVPLGSAAAPFTATGKDGISIDTKTWAVFTQEDFKITDWFSITAGGRYTHEHLTNMLASFDYNYFTGTYSCQAGSLASNGVASTITGIPIPVPGVRESCAYAQGTNASGQFATAFGPNDSFHNAVFTGWSYLFSANFQVTRDILFYFRTARGFRGGAFGRNNAPAAQPEIATDYELGFKGDFLEHRVRLNVALYQTNYTNKQVSVLTCAGGGTPPCTLGFGTAVLNAATARMRGFEVEGQVRPFEGMSIFGNLSYNDAVYTKWLGAVSGDGTSLNVLDPSNPTGSAAGFDLGVVPKWQGNLGTRYEHPIGPGIGAIEVNYQYIGNVAITPITRQYAVPLAIEQYMQRAVGLVDARIEFRLPEQGLTFSIWGSNLANVYWGREGISASFNAGIGHLLVSDPRMYGITIRKTFGAD